METYFAYHVEACEFLEQYLRTVESSMSLVRDSAAWELVKKAALQVDWDGKFQSEPCLFFLPSENGLLTAFAWHQASNGDLIVVAPTELPWLKKQAQSHIDDHITPQLGEFSKFDLDN